jgi:hypothetical protein
MARNKLISREGPTHPGVVINDYTSFEVYLVTGVVFLLGFTLSVVLSTLGQMERMVWFGWLATLILTAVTFFGLRARELRLNRLKRREVDRLEADRS